MTLLRTGTTSQGLLFTAASASAVTFQSVGPTEGLTISVVAEYVDTDGDLQTATADSSTTPTISGVAPFYVWFDVSGSRSVSTDANTEGKAWTNMGYRFDSGEGIAGNWSLTGLPKNVVEGAPVFGHLFTEAGSHVSTFWVRDSEGRQGSVTVNMNISAPGAGVDVAEGGSWPTITDNMVLNLAAGSNHSGKGTLNLSGRYGVRIRKTGVGAGPIVSRINWDNRFVESSPVARTRNCSIQGINVPVVGESPIGSLYCSLVDHPGTVRHAAESLTYWWETGTTTENQKNNIRYSRGTCWWNINEMVSDPDNGGYVLIWGAKNCTFRNVDFNKTVGLNNSHVFRGGEDGFDMRYNRFRVATQTMSYNKIQGWNNGSTFDTWSPEDRVGVWNGAQYQYVCRKMAVEHNIYGAAGSNNTVGTNIEVLPENNDLEPAQAIEMISVANNIWYTASWVGMNNSFSGRNLYFYNNKLNLGAGTETPYDTGERPNRIPSGWDGPYVNAARPVVVP